MVHAQGDSARHTTRWTDRIALLRDEGHPSDETWTRYVHPPTAWGSERQQPRDHRRTLGPVLPRHRPRRAHRARRRAYPATGVVRAEHLLGFPDGGLEPLLRAHWQHTRPERSSTTGAHEPPYGEAEYLDLRYDGADLRAALVRCLREFRPTTVALPDPLDRHPA